MNEILNQLQQQSVNVFLQQKHHENNCDNDQLSYYYYEVDDVR